jgi:hypothetical protein
MTPLSQVPTKVEGDPTQYMTMVHGDAGTGKTTFISQIEGHYILYPEAGIKGVSVYGEPVLDWPGFIRIANELVAAKREEWVNQREVKVICVDTYEALWDVCGKWICENQKFLVKGKMEHYDKPQDVPWGAGYRAVNDLILEKLNKLLLFGFGIFLTSHTRERVIQWRGQDFTHYGPNLTTTSAEAIVAACDAVGYFTIEQEVNKDETGKLISTETGRRAYWQPTFLRVAKHRLPNFAEWLPLPLGSAWEGYKTEFADKYKASLGE